MLSRFHLIPERNRRQTGRQTDGRTDLLYQYRRASVCWRAIIKLMRLCTRTAYILSVINLSRPVATNLGNLYHVGRSLHTVEQYVFLKLGPLLLGLRGIVLRLHGPMDGHNRPTSIPGTLLYWTFDKLFVISLHQPRGLFSFIAPEISILMHYRLHGQMDGRILSF